MTKMFIPDMYKMNPTRNFVAGGSVTGTVRMRELRAMISALESVGLVVRQPEPGHFTCHVNGQEILNAQKGNRSTYLTRYAEGITALIRKSK